MFVSFSRSVRRPCGIHAAKKSEVFETIKKNGNFLSKNDKFLSKVDKSAVGNRFFFFRLLLPVRSGRGRCAEQARPSSGRKRTQKRRRPGQVCGGEPHCCPVCVGGTGEFILNVAFAHQVFRNLHGVQRRTLLDLVAHNPERQSVVVGQVAADAAHVDGVFAGQEQGHRILLLRRVVHQHEALAPGERSEIQLTFDASKADLWGKFQPQFGLIVNGQKQPDPVKMSVIFVEDFSTVSRTALKMAPRADYSSFFYHFSDQPQGKTLTREFQITNGGQSDLIIRHIGPTSSRIKAKIDKTVIRPGDTATLTVTLDSKGVTGRLGEGVTIVTNDPARPARDIRVLANIVE